MIDKAPQSNIRTKVLLLARYALAGGLTSGVYIVVYNTLVHFDVVRFLSSNLAYAGALLVQYSAHGKFTFGHRETQKGVLWRYLIAIYVIPSSKIKKRQLVILPRITGHQLYAANPNASGV